jgi:ferredoxin-NADP reductase
MAEFPVKIISTAYVTHNVKRILIEKPAGYAYVPGQGADISIDADGWRDKKRAFTFTSLNSWNHLELIVKIYRNHQGVTAQMEKLHNGHGLIVGEPWGAIQYKGPGVFLSGGIGITPFVAIFRQLEQDRKLVGNVLVASYRSSRDVVLDKEFGEMLGPEYFKLFTRENVVGFHDARLHEDQLVAMVHDFNRNFYLCGPAQFVDDLQKILANLGVASDALIVED